MSADTRLSPLSPVLPTGSGDKKRWSRLYGSSRALAVARAAAAHAGPVVAVVPDTPTAMRLTEELQFFCDEQAALPVYQFPDWETLPYDVFSPHHDIVSERLATLYRLPDLQRGVLVVPVNTALARLLPADYLLGNTFLLAPGDRLDMDALRQRLQQAGYRHVGQVMEHGEFSVRGSLLDLFPMGSAQPYRIDLLDDEVDSLRTFDPETQRTLSKVEQLNLVPAREFPIDEAGITRFRQSWRTRFEGDPTNAPLYRDVSEGLAPSGIEYYLPLFFEQLATLFDYLPSCSLVALWADSHAASDTFWDEVKERYESRRHDTERPLVEPGVSCIFPPRSCSQRSAHTRRRCWETLPVTAAVLSSTPPALPSACPSTAVPASR